MCYETSAAAQPPACAAYLIKRLTAYCHLSILVVNSVVSDVRHGTVHTGREVTVVECNAGVVKVSQVVSVVEAQISVGINIVVMPIPLPAKI